MPDLSAINDSIADRLKAETRAQHDSAERHDLQRALLKGALPRERYLALIGQLMLAHRALAAAIRQAATREPRLSRVWRDDYDQAPRIARDLAHFGMNPSSVEPTPATSAFIELIRSWASETPITLLGALYVLEGSNNGARFIARVVRDVYPVGADDAGASFLDPYGEAQPVRWGEFRSALNALELSRADKDAIIDAARATFVAISAIGDDVMAQPAG